MKPLASRSDFPLLAGYPELRYLDSAATAQKPKAVLDAERAFYEHHYANPHRGAYALSARATDTYHAARARIARFVGLADADCLIFTRGTTESLNLVAAACVEMHVFMGACLLCDHRPARCVRTGGPVFLPATPAGVRCEVSR